MLSVNTEQYDNAKLLRLSKSEDFAEFERVADGILKELDSVRNVNKDMAEADVLGRIHAYNALEELMATIKGAEQAMNINNSEEGDYNYT